MTGLAVNVDHIATLRQARGVSYPDPVAAAVLAELAGADGIVVHLREDRRHIQDRDVYLLRKTISTKMILEMAITDEIMEIACEIRPEQVTLVPEKREELTTEGGLDVNAKRKLVTSAVKRLHEKGISVSLFIDPDPAQIEASAAVGADLIEIHTGTFCDAVGSDKKKRAFTDIIESARLGRKMGLGINAGHGLCYNTIKWFRGSGIIDEFSIGHSIISRAALVGMERAVREMIALVKETAA